MRFVGYIRKDDEIGNLLRIQMDQHQQVIGSGKQFLELSSLDYPYGESSRIQFLWDKYTQHKITLHVQGAWNQKLAKKGDVFLMDNISKVIQRPELLTKLNNVRLYLKVSRLSDIVTADG